MKTKDVEVGGKYLCRVGDRIAIVTVIERITGNIRPGYREPDTFRVRRLGTHADLPKARSAAALRPLETPQSPLITIDARDLITIDARDIPQNTPCIVNQANYLDACEHNVGWCTHCKAFSQAKSMTCPMTCPRCGQNTVEECKQALLLGHIDPKEEE